MHKKKIVAGILAAVICVSTAGSLVSTYETTTVSAEEDVYQVEYLDRGITAVTADDGIFVSWRFLASDSSDTVFKLYRNDTLVYTSEADESTCYLDTEGSTSDTYRVDAVDSGVVTSSEECSLTSDEGNYFDIDLDPPEATIDGVTYSPNDCSVGDADGDGEYEIFLKWDPSNSKDNSQSGTTDKVYIDCYKMDGTRLWRIDLGINIRAGAHYTQFYVADFDLDGYAEMTCKTADGTVDGLGNVIGDEDADYRNSSGYILSGPEYYTLFDGLTGEALDTVDYEPARGTVSDWGDKYGNRVDRFWGTVAYLDGVTPCVVTGRGYYTRLTATAYTVENKKLVQLWTYDSDENDGVGEGQGNHQSMAADVDGDGCQEIITGATCIDQDGTILWCTDTGHGDALHLGDFLPDRDGLELWVCHEDSPYGVTLFDAATGEEIFHVDGDDDTGRCCADNVWSGNDGAEFWGLNYDVYNGDGETLDMNCPSKNFLCYWDGDLEREILDGYTDTCATIYDVNDDGSISTLMTTDGYYTCNTTKGTPCLSADIFGDWREEVIVRAADGESIRIYTTTYDTDYRIQTLMQDPQYRVQVSSQNTAYNQPPHASFYLGSDEELPTYLEVEVLDEPEVQITAATLTDGAVYTFQNVNSGLYLTAEDGTAEDGTNIVQAEYTDDLAAAQTWRAVSAGGGYYYLYCQIGDTVSYVLDVYGGAADSGTNVNLWSLSGNDDAQTFLFYENDDGSYTIYTAASDKTGCVEVADASLEEGANVQQWELNGNDCQHWNLTLADEVGVEMSTSDIFQIQNLNSELYMNVEGGTKEDGTNLQQWGTTGAASYDSWTLQSVGDNYYRIVSQMGDGETWFLTIEDGKSASGTNVYIWSDDGTNAQYFKFVANVDGTYCILSKASGCDCALAVEDASTSNGGNIIQETLTYADHQKWNLIDVGDWESDEETTTEEATTEEEETTTSTESTTSVEDTSEDTTATESTSTETATVAVLYGDVNCNGTVNLADVILMYQYSANLVDFTEQQILNGDVNADGSTDQEDPPILFQYEVDLISALPYTES